MLDLIREKNDMMKSVSQSDPSISRFTSFKGFDGLCATSFATTVLDATSHAPFECYNEEGRRRRAAQHDSIFSMS